MIPVMISTLGLFLAPNRSNLHPANRLPEPDTEDPQWNPPWRFLTLLVILILTIIYHYTK